MAYYTEDRWKPIISPYSGEAYPPCLDEECEGPVNIDFEPVELNDGTILTQEYITCRHCGKAWMYSECGFWEEVDR